VKRPKYCPSNVSDAQDKMHHDLAERGFPVAIVTSDEEARQFLMDRGAPWKVPRKVLGSPDGSGA
jgi:hypothetical protein